MSSLLPALTATGHTDTAYVLLNQRTEPSWGYFVDNGATTMTESWPMDGSQNHYALGSVGDWMYQTVGGIAPDPTAPGYKSFVVQPQPGGGLTWASASYESQYGQIRSSWKLTSRVFTLDVHVPVNSTATVHVPLLGFAGVRGPAGTTLVSQTGSEAVYRVGSGHWVFANSAEG